MFHFNYGERDKRETYIGMIDVLHVVNGSSSVICTLFSGVVPPPYSELRSIDDRKTVRQARVYNRVRKKGKTRLTEKKP